MQCNGTTWRNNADIWLIRKSRTTWVRANCRPLSSQQALKSVGTNYTDKLEVLDWSGVNSFQGKK